MARDLSGQIETGQAEFEVPPHQPEGVGQLASVGSAVREMLSEERKKSETLNMVWNEKDRLALRAGSGKPIPRDKRDKDSGFDKRLPSMGPYGGKSGYWVQNRRIFLGRKKLVELAEVPEKMSFPEKRFPKGTVLEAGTEDVRKEVRKALEGMDEKACAADKLICRVCIEKHDWRIFFRGRSDIDLLAHMLELHPKESKDLAEGMKKIREEEAEAELAPPLPVPAADRPRQNFRAAG
jgi:hypothetical protein